MGHAKMPVEATILGGRGDAVRDVVVDVGRPGRRAPPVVDLHWRWYVCMIGCVYARETRMDTGEEERGTVGERRTEKAGGQLAKAMKWGSRDTSA